MEMSFNGCLIIPTPNIDSVAANARLCHQRICHAPRYCSPSRAALITGRYQQRLDTILRPPVDNDNPALGLPLEELTFPAAVETRRLCLRSDR